MSDKTTTKQFPWEDEINRSLLSCVGGSDPRPLQGTLLSLLRESSAAMDVCMQEKKFKNAKHLCTRLRQILAHIAIRKVNLHVDTSRPSLVDLTAAILSIMLDLQIFLTSKPKKAIAKDKATTQIVQDVLLFTGPETFYLWDTLLQSTALKERRDKIMGFSVLERLIGESPWKQVLEPEAYLKCLLCWRLLYLHSNKEQKSQVRSQALTMPVPRHLYKWLKAHQIPDLPSLSKKEPAKNFIKPFLKALDPTAADALCEALSEDILEGDSEVATEPNTSAVDTFNPATEWQEPVDEKDSLFVVDRRGLSKAEKLYQQIDNDIAEIPDLTGSVLERTDSVADSASESESVSSRNEAGVFLKRKRDLDRELSLRKKRHLQTKLKDLNVNELSSSEEDIMQLDDDSLIKLDDLELKKRKTTPQKSEVQEQKTRTPMKQNRLSFSENSLENQKTLTLNDHFENEESNSTVENIVFSPGKTCRFEDSSTVLSMSCKTEWKSPLGSRKEHDSSVRDSATQLSPKRLLSNNINIRTLKNELESIDDRQSVTSVSSKQTRSRSASFEHSDISIDGLFVSDAVCQTNLSSDECDGPTDYQKILTPKRQNENNDLDKLLKDALSQELLSRRPVLPVQELENSSEEFLSPETSPENSLAGSSKMYSPAAKQINENKDPEKLPEDNESQKLYSSQPCRALPVHELETSSEEFLSPETSPESSLDGSSKMSPLGNRSFAGKLSGLLMQTLSPIKTPRKRSSATPVKAVVSPEITKQKQSTPKKSPVSSVYKSENLSSANVSSSKKVVSDKVKTCSVSKLLFADLGTSPSSEMHTIELVSIDDTDKCEDISALARSDSTTLALESDSSLLECESDQDDFRTRSKNIKRATSKESIVTDVLNNGRNVCQSFLSPVNVAKLSTPSPVKIKKSPSGFSALNGAENESIQEVSYSSEHKKMTSTPKTPDKVSEMFKNKRSSSPLLPEEHDGDKNTTLTTQLETGESGITKESSFDTEITDTTPSPVKRERAIREMQKFSSDVETFIQSLEKNNTSMDDMLDCSGRISRCSVELERLSSPDISEKLNSSRLKTQCSVKHKRAKHAFLISSDSESNASSADTIPNSPKQAKHCNSLPDWNRKIKRTSIENSPSAFTHLVACSGVPKSSRSPNLQKVLIYDSTDTENDYQTQRIRKYSSTSEESSSSGSERTLKCDSTVTSTQHLTPTNSVSFEKKVTPTSEVACQTVLHSRHIAMLVPQIKSRRKAVAPSKSLTQTPTTKSTRKTSQKMKNNSVKKNLIELNQKTNNLSGDATPMSERVTRSLSKAAVRTTRSKKAFNTPEGSPTKVKVSDYPSPSKIQHQDQPISKAYVLRSKRIKQEKKP